MENADYFYREAFDSGALKDGEAVAGHSPFDVADRHQCGPGCGLQLKG